ncbi:MAG TPA: hypothetical protein VL574_09150 [Stellaceae bacterium]|nr:hypothetical protein [Stellaceae bacterium]
MAKILDKRRVSLLAPSAFLMVGALLMVGTGGTARAQAPVVYGDGSGSVAPVAPASGSDATTITDPQQVAACLCAESAMRNARAEMLMQHQKYDDAINRLHQLNDQVTSRRDQVDPSQPDQVQAYRNLVAESERANALVYNHATPDYDAAVHRYNDSVATYNSTCAGRGITPELRAQVQANLYCPASHSSTTTTTTISPQPSP